LKYIVSIIKYFESDFLGKPELPSNVSPGCMLWREKTMTNFWRTGFWPECTCKLKPDCPYRKHNFSIWTHFQRDREILTILKNELILIYENVDIVHVFIEIYRIHY
jgi:hypothetical protein